MISRHARVANTLSRSFIKSFTSQPSRVLVLYTGGTIGMELSPEGYRPKYNYLTSFLRSNALFHDAKFAASINLEPDMLVTPELGKRIAYRVEEYKTLLDSSNMNMSNWVQIATSIAQSYSHYDGFVVIHGTDTMRCEFGSGRLFGLTPVALRRRRSRSCCGI